MTDAGEAGGRNRTAEARGRRERLKISHGVYQIRRFSAAAAEDQLRCGVIQNFHNT
jgi:hypothetical protein